MMKGSVFCKAFCVGLILVCFVSWGQQNVLSAPPHQLGTAELILCSAQGRNTSAKIHLLLIGGTDSNDKLDPGVQISLRMMDHLFFRNVPRERHVKRQIKGREVTATNVVLTIRNMPDVGPEDAVVVYYSGHGYYSGRPGGQVTASGSFLKMPFGSGNLSRDRIVEAAESLRPRLVVLITDMCSGLLPSREPLGGAGFAPPTDVSVLFRDLFLVPRGVVDICGTIPPELGWYYIPQERCDNGGGFFTRSLIKTAEELQGGSRETQRVTWGEFLKGVQTRLTKEFRDSRNYGYRLDGNTRQWTHTIHRYDMPRWDPKRELTNSIGMKFVFIPAGEFMMGSPEDEIFRDHFNFEEEHWVRITKPFYLGVYEVTQQEYERVTGTNPSHFSRRNDGKDKVFGMDTSRFPVEQIMWEKSVEFCRKLSSLPAERSSNRVYRLPTEAEWEYACRAGTTTPFHFGSTLNGREANCNGGRPFPNFTGEKGPFLGRTTAVGSYTPNGFGLYDMHGNVNEWCQDWLDEVGDYYRKSPVDDPKGPSIGNGHSSRGGSWYYNADNCRSASRGGKRSEYPFDFTDGFRVVLVPADLGG